MFNRKTHIREVSLFVDGSTNMGSSIIHWVANVFDKVVEHERVINGITHNPQYRGIRCIARFGTSGQVPCMIDPDRMKGTTYQHDAMKQFGIDISKHNNTQAHDI